MDDQTTSTQSTKVAPDSNTIERIKNLADVGTALLEETNENAMQTRFMEALASLDKFAEGIAKLQLDAPSEKGMHDLIEYLRGKIKRRLDNSYKYGDENF